MNKYLVLIILVVFAVFIFSGTATATEKISKNKNEANNNGQSYTTSQSISADGRYVVFESSASDLVEGDNNDHTDIFLRDTVTKKTQRVNYKKNGIQPTGDCDGASISANGRCIVYETTDDMGFGPAGYLNIYLYDRNTQSTELVSKNSKQEPGNSYSFRPSLSADGRYIAFESVATNLCDPNSELFDDTNNKIDIFVRDRMLQTTKRINLDSAGEQANGDSSFSYISGDGRYVAFQSLATNLVNGLYTQGDGGYYDLYYNIFVRDIWAGTTKRIMGMGDQEMNGFSFNHHLSTNGRYLVFDSCANNLVPNDHNEAWDVFLADMFTPGKPKIGLISLSSSQKQGNRGSFVPNISADGRYITFQSDATNLVSGDTNGKEDVFVHDLKTAQTKRLSVSSNGKQANAESWKPIISGNGKYVVFGSKATNLVSGDTNLSDVFINTVDFVGPLIKAVAPKNNAKKTKRSSNIYVYFNENIRIASSAKIILKNKKGKIITTAKSISGNKLIINPTKKLTKNTRYYIYILAGAVSDFANNYNYNTKKYTFQFTTGKK